METFWDNKWLTQGQATAKEKEEDWYDIYKESERRRRKMRDKEIKKVVKAVNVKKAEPVAQVQQVQKVQGGKPSKVNEDILTINSKVDMMEEKVMKMTKQMNIMD